MQPPFLISEQGSSRKSLRLSRPCTQNNTVNGNLIKLIHRESLINCDNLFSVKKSLHQLSCDSGHKQLMMPDCEKPSESYANNVQFEEIGDVYLNGYSSNITTSNGEVHHSEDQKDTIVEKSVACDADLCTKSEQPDLLIEKDDEACVCEVTDSPQAVERNGSSSNDNIIGDNLAVAASSSVYNSTVINTDLKNCNQEDFSTCTEINGPLVSDNPVSQKPQLPNNCPEKCSVDEQSEVKSIKLSDKCFTPKVRSCLKRPIPSKESEAENIFPESRKRQRVVFDSVHVNYFTRSQGFVCVPSQGGSTLGMSQRHWAEEHFPVGIYGRARRRQRRAILYQHCLEGKLSLSADQREALERDVARNASLLSLESPFMPSSVIIPSSCASSCESSPLNCDAETCSDSGISSLACLPDTHSDCASSICGDDCPPSDAVAEVTLGVIQEVPSLAEVKDHDSPVGSSMEEEDEDEDDQEALSFLEDHYFLQPVPIKRRRMMLKEGGLDRIDQSERSECHEIRVSREVCGCDCPEGRCLPETCLCSREGIKCQVDRANFPCSCSRTNCVNTAGRVEFNPARVKAHFIHTQMRLEMERQGTSGGSLTGSCEESPVGPDWDLSAYNSTEQGSCRDCQNDRYIQVLMTELRQSGLLGQQQIPPAQPLLLPHRHMVVAHQTDYFPTAHPHTLHHMNAVQAYSHQQPSIAPWAHPTPVPQPDPASPREDPSDEEGSEESEPESEEEESPTSLGEYCKLDPITTLLTPATPVELTLEQSVEADFQAADPLHSGYHMESCLGSEPQRLRDAQLSPELTLLEPVMGSAFLPSYYSAHDKLVPLRPVPLPDPARELEIVSRSRERRSPPPPRQYHTRRAAMLSRRARAYSGISVSPVTSPLPSSSLAEVLKESLIETVTA